MNERGSVRLCDTTIDYEVRRSQRRKKTVEITLDSDGGVRVAAPAGLSSEEIHGIVRRRAPWILRTASTERLQTTPRRFVNGETLPYLGRSVRLIVERCDAGRASVTFDHWSFLARVPGFLSGEERVSVIRKALIAWYRARAAERLPKRVERWSSLLGRSPSQVLIRDQRRRWGSCGPDGTLRFNWRIVMAEPALIDYVIVHELAHLAVNNHSPRFWAEVARALPDYKLRRKRLKEVGSDLTL